ncbi:MAG: CIC family chloride channel protein [Cyclobacteriaceae bacterium]|jgi:CIC family chloride channel protein
MNHKFRKRLTRFSMRGFRHSLASFDAVRQFAILGIISGAVTGVVILAFRTLIEIPLAIFLDNDFDNFEALPQHYYFIVPVVGAIGLAILLSLIKKEHRSVGPVHVLERLARHQGHLPWQNALTQFCAGIIALASGQSGGREGPAIHLGAAGSSLLGQSLSLPNNSIRILVGCGAAAAISASFNTPMAGVIFSMEVIIMEYTIAGFIPVILAAVTATMINNLMYGNETAFFVPLTVADYTLYDVPFLVLEGFLIGTIAAIFVNLIALIYRYAPAAIGKRMLIAGIVTGLLALAVPQVLGVGYDTVTLALEGNLGLVLLIAACTFKLIATATTIALGVPVGVIGPTIFIGAMAGGALGILGATLMPDTASSPGFYVMLGMGAMMGAVLQAPLAALMAVMELTNNSQIILPAMLVIIVANLTANQAFKVESIFTTQMKILGLEFRQNPLSMALNRASVASIMTRSFRRVARVISLGRAQELSREKPTWLLVDSTKGPSFILRTEDLTQYLKVGNDKESIDLTEIPATRKDVRSIMLQATLSEALDTLNSTGVQALYVTRISAPMIDSAVGIIDRSDIESFYQS